VVIFIVSLLRLQSYKYSLKISPVSGGLTPTPKNMITWREKRLGVSQRGHHNEVLKTETEDLFKQIECERKKNNHISYNC